MAADDPTHEADELRLLADDCAREARLFLETARGLATGQAPDAALPLALLALSQVLTMGARLGAMQDVVPTLRFEPTPGRSRAPRPSAGGSPTSSRASTTTWTSSTR